MLSVLNSGDEGPSPTSNPRPRGKRPLWLNDLNPRHLLKQLATSAGTCQGLTIIVGVILTVALTIALHLNDLDISNHINEHGISSADFYADSRMEIVDAAATKRKIDRTQQSLSPIYQDEQPHNRDIVDGLEKLLDDLEPLVTLPEIPNPENVHHLDPTKLFKPALPLNEEERQRRFIKLLEHSSHARISSAETLYKRLFKKPISAATWAQVSDAARVTMRKVLSGGFTEADDQLKRRELLSDSLPLKPAYPARFRELVMLMVDARLQPNRILDEVAMKSKQEEVASHITEQPETIVFNKGQKIVGRGERVSSLQRDALEKMGQLSSRHHWLPILGSLMLSSLFVYGMWSSLRYFRKGEFFKPGYALLTGTLVLFTFVFLQFHQHKALLDSIPPYAFPLATFSLTLAIFTHPTISILCTTLLVFLAALTLRTDFQSLAILLSGSCIGVYALGRRIHHGSRGHLMVSGFYVGAANALLLIALSLMKPNLGGDVLLDAHQPGILDLGMSGLKTLTWSFFGGIFAGILTIGSLPLLEWVFGLVTPYTLMELGNHDQPLLKRMQFEAPGTFHHSLMVATLAEAATQGIGGNALLTRVGCLYHDIGKMKRPLFFIENQAYFGVENPHDKLTPRLSKMVITAHPRDSLEMARQHKLPECLMSFMTEHHGTLTAGYFYNKACQEEGPENVNKSQFRYPGPKPQSKETAIVMLADACESAVRALKNPTVAQVEERIDKIIHQRIEESQFDDCPITLQDLNSIKQTFVRILRGIQHSRIEYQQNMMRELGRKLPGPAGIEGNGLQEVLKTIQPPPPNDMIDAQNKTADA